MISPILKTAVIFGAGNIGRGFIAQLFTQSGYKVIFIDVNRSLVDKINQDQSYPIEIVSNKGNYEIKINPVHAVHGLDQEGIALAICSADILATAVGVHALPGIAGPLAAGLHRRWQNNQLTSLNIIICENLLHANHVLKELVRTKLDLHEHVLLDQSIGFVEASIGRMVPAATKIALSENLLRIITEAFDELPVDREGFVGEIPEIKNMIAVSPFGFFIQRKLYIHNMGHAITAYLGYLTGYQYIWESIRDLEIHRIVSSAMLEAAQALAKEHGVGLDIIRVYLDDLLDRFDNIQLGDTVMRVGRDVKRKLAPQDRLIGALNLCVKHHLKCENICTGIAAAFLFQEPDLLFVPSSHTESEVEQVMSGYCELEKGSEEWNSIKKHYRQLINRYSSN
ncbi:MAG: mannitol dehydrogenase [Eubacteriales bacterium]|nr:mannitol dehydrogenase [Eubacteriales bacterium]